MAPGLALVKYALVVRCASGSMSAGILVPSEGEARASAANALSRYIIDTSVKDALPRAVAGRPISNSGVRS